MRYQRVRAPLRWGAALLAALLLGTILAACGGDDKDDGNAELPESHFSESRLSYNHHAPDFTLRDTEGRAVELVDYLERAQPVLLFFHMADG